jgi:IPT/TIG domain
MHADHNVQLLLHPMYMHTLTGVTYEYVPLADVSSVFPPRGPNTGGTEVLVVGSYFKQSAALSCRFGDTPVPVSAYLNSTHIICVAPASRLTGT